METRNVPISNAIDKFISGNWGDSEQQQDSTIVHCIRGADFDDVTNGTISAPERYISSKNVSRHTLPKNSIVIEKSGGSPTQSTGRVILVTEDIIKKSGLPLVCSNFCSAFTIRSDWDAGYVYWVLVAYYNSGAFFNFEGKTTGIKNLQVERAFDKILIPKYPIEVQEKIARILNNIQSRIIINNDTLKVNDKLLTTIYNYWFRQFKVCKQDVPDGSLPIGWKEVKISEIATLYQPKTISASEMSDSGEYLVYGANGIVGKYKDFNHENSEIAICCRGASCGDYLMTTPKSWITGNAMVVHPTNDEYKEYIYYGLSKESISPFITGSAQPQITRANLEKMPIIIPDRESLRKFNLIAASVRAQRDALFKSTSKLEKLKDVLLPALLIGKIKLEK